MAIIWVGTGRFNAYIGPVQDYIDRVVAADVAAGNTLGLEVGVRDAYDVFIRDSIDVGDLGTSGGVLSQANSIIKAAPIIAGARTMAGALVPLVGPAPTNVNFVDEPADAEAGDYNRETGLVGDGSTKYLNSGYAFPTSLINNCHIAGYFTVNNTVGVAVGYAESGGNGSYLACGSARLYNAGDSTFVPSDTTTTGFRGISRSSSQSFLYRRAGSNQTASINSYSLTHQSQYIFARRVNTGIDNFSNPRLTFYSIGESLDLALLDARVTTLMAAIGAAIP